MAVCNLTGIASQTPSILYFIHQLKLWIEVKLSKTWPWRDKTSSKASRADFSFPNKENRGVNIFRVCLLRYSFYFKIKQNNLTITSSYPTMIVMIGLMESSHGTTTTY